MKETKTQKTYDLPGGMKILEGYEDYIKVKEGSSLGRFKEKPSYR